MARMFHKISLYPIIAIEIMEAMLIAQEVIGAFLSFNNNKCGVVFFKNVVFNQN